MDFVDEKNVPRLEIGEDGGEVARTLEHRTGGLLHVDAHLARDDVRERRLAKARRAEQQYVVERLGARARRLHEDLELAAYLFLADVLGERRGAQRALDLLLLLRRGLGRDEAVCFDAHRGILPERVSRSASELVLHTERAQVDPGVV